MIWHAIKIVRIVNTVSQYIVIFAEKLKPTVMAIVENARKPLRGRSGSAIKERGKYELESQTFRDYVWSSKDSAASACRLCDKA